MHHCFEDKFRIIVFRTTVFLNAKVHDADLKRRDSNKGTYCFSVRPKTKAKTCENNEMFAFGLVSGQASHKAPFVGGRHVAPNRRRTSSWLWGTKSERLLDLKRCESSRIGTTSGLSLSTLSQSNWNNRISLLISCKRHDAIQNRQFGTVFKLS